MALKYCEVTKPSNSHVFMTSVREYSNKLHGNMHVEKSKL